MFWASAQFLCRAFKRTPTGDHPITEMIVAVFDTASAADAAIRDDLEAVGLGPHAQALLVHDPHDPLVVGDHAIEARRWRQLGFGVSACDPQVRAIPQRSVYKECAPAPVWPNLANDNVLSHAQ